MRLNSTSHRFIAGLVLATVAAGSLAPAAFAGQGAGTWKSRRDRGAYVERSSRAPRYVVHRGSSAGPAIAGFVGGLALGTLLSNRSDHGGRVAYDRGCEAPVVQRRVYVRQAVYRGDYGGQMAYRGGYGGRGECEASAYYYVDPWTNQRYASLDAYSADCRGHTPIAKVIDANTGEWVQTVCRHDGGWHDYDASDPPWERCR